MSRRLAAAPRGLHRAPVRATLALVLRLGAIAIVVLPAVLGVLLHDLSWGGWVGPGLAVAGGAFLTVVRPRARYLVLLGTMLAVLASLAAPQVPLGLGEPTLVDLRREQAPASLRGPVVVTGFFRDEWTMAEYAVAEGQLPQQDEPPEALLVPLLGVDQGAVPLHDVVLVARVRPGQEKQRGVQTLRGTARALEPELLGAFVQASGVDAPPGLIGVVVDAEHDSRTPGWLRGGLVVLAMLGGLVCLLVAVRREPPRILHPDEVSP